MSNKGVLQQANERLTQVAHTVSGVNYTGSDRQWPAFDDLPKVNGQPQGCIWGLFDTEGKRDEVGTVNLLTPTLVKSAAATEIRKGEHIQLDWSLENVQFPGFGRKPFAQTVIDLDKLGFKAMDDEIYINTQSGSQWDSLRHFAHQASGMYYNGLAHADAVHNTRNGIHNWVERGGIVGRGILVDWVRWYEHKHGKPPPSPVTRHEIPLSEIKETIEYQGLKPLPGDIAIFRSGYVRWHDTANADDRKAGTQAASNAIGLVQNEEMVRWLYDQHFSAVVGDTVAFEAWPPPIEKGWCLHEWLLVQWGTPIGEMWNLEDLSKKCEEENRWTFFLTSAPLHYKGCVGSPPGAIAIF